MIVQQPISNVYVQFRLEDQTKWEYVTVSDVWGEHTLLDRNELPGDAIIISRYSCLPFYAEMENEIVEMGSRLVTSYADHLYLSGMKWYDTLKGLTPTTWFDLGEVEKTDHGYVVKGLCYSRKFHWDTYMRAEDLLELNDVIDRLGFGDLVRNQELAIREFVPLRSYGTHENGLPITEEWRCFFAGTTPIASGFYWSKSDKADDRGVIPEEAQDLAQCVADQIDGDLQSDDALLAIDVAQTEEGGWILIEINNGSMAGLSAIDPEHFYTQLQKVYCE